MSCYGDTNLNIGTSECGLSCFFYCKVLELAAAILFQRFVMLHHGMVVNLGADLKYQTGLSREIVAIVVSVIVKFRVTGNSKLWGSHGTARPGCMVLSPDELLNFKGCNSIR